MEDYLISNEEDILPAMDDQVDESLELVEIFMTVKGDPSTGMLWVEGIPTGVFVSEVPYGRYRYLPALEAFNNNQIDGGSLI
jgi:hypothetical protein